MANRIGWGRTKPPCGSRINFGHPLSQGLLGYWLLNENGGLTAIDSVQRLQGNIVGAVWGQGNFGNALNFSLATSYVDLPTMATIAPLYDSGRPFSFSFWAYKPDSNQTRVAFGETDGTVTTRLYLLQNGTTAGAKTGVFRFAVSTSIGPLQAGLNGTLTCFEGRWHHIVWVDNLGTISLYVDGVLDPTNFNYTRGGTMTATKEIIGARYRSDVGINTPWTGFLDNFRIYNRALSWQEAIQLFVDPFAGILMPRRRNIVGSTTAVALNNNSNFFVFM